MQEELNEIFSALNIKAINPGSISGNDRFDSKKYLISESPIDGEAIGKVSITSKEEYESIVKSAEKAFHIWRDVPAPKRGEIVRQFGDKLREAKEPLGKLVSLEMGKLMHRAHITS